MKIFSWLGNILMLPVKLVGYVLGTVFETVLSKIISLIVWAAIIVAVGIYFEWFALSDVIGLFT